MADITSSAIKSSVSSGFSLGEIYLYVKAVNYAQENIPISLISILRILTKFLLRELLDVRNERVSEM